MLEYDALSRSMFAVIAAGSFLRTKYTAECMQKGNQDSTNAFPGNVLFSLIWSRSSSLIGRRGIAGIDDCILYPYYVLLEERDFNSRVLSRGAN